jgi:hypothetical protein
VSKVALGRNNKAQRTNYDGTAVSRFEQGHAHKVTAMTELLSKFDPGEVIGLVAVAGFWLSAIVAILSGAWHRVRRAEIQAALKQDMLTRGLSAEEIRTVIEAGSVSYPTGVRSHHHCRG